MLLSPLVSFYDPMLDRFHGFFQQMEASCRKEVDEAVKQAKADPELPISELYTHIYKDPPQDYEIRGCDPYTWVKATA